MASVAILDQTICVHILCTLWSGTRRLTREDLGADARVLPPSHIATTGTLKVIDPRVITVLHSEKRRAQRACEALCVRFLNAYAGDERIKDELIEKLEAVKASFDDHAATIVADLPDHFESWVRDNPEQADLIRAAQPTVDHVAARLSFDYQIYRIGAARTEQGEIDEAAVENRGLVKATEGLSGQLFSEIEQAAREARYKTFEGRTVVGQKALGPIKTIRTKLDALRFIDTRVAGLVQHIDNVLGSIASTGQVTGNELMSVIGLLDVLSDADRMTATGVAPVATTVSPQATSAPQCETPAVEIVLADTTDDTSDVSAPVDGSEGDDVEPEKTAEPVSSGGFFSF